MQQEKIEHRLMATGDDVTAFNTWHREINKLYEDMRTLKHQFEVDSVSFTKQVFKLINMATEQMRTMAEVGNTDIKKLYSDFSDLAKVTKLKEAYEQTLPEISRRKDFSQRLSEACQNIKVSIDEENKKRAYFLKKYANILLETFVPDLKKMLPDFVDKDNAWSMIDRSLPSVTGMHSVDDVSLTKINVSARVEDNSDLKAVVESMELERNELKAKVYALEKRVAGMRIDISMLKEKNETLSYVDQADRSINVSSYYTLLDANSSLQNKKSTVAEILKANAKQLYKYFGPLLTSKNAEIKEMRKEMVDHKLRYGQYNEVMSATWTNRQEMPIAELNRI